MKKVGSMFLIVVLAVLVVLTSQQLNAAANLVPTPFTSYLGDGSSLVLYNPQELGTTTLFRGTNVTANGTVANENINFNIYGNDSLGPQLSITASRKDYYLVPNNNSFIDTGIIPNGETKLEVFFMIPENNTIATDAPAAHPDVAGCNAADAAYHFGGPLLMKNTSRIQFLYGIWSDGDLTVTAKDNTPTNGNTPTESYMTWSGGNQYHSILNAHNGGADIFLTDYSKTYEEHIENTDNSKYANAATAEYRTLYMFGQNNGNLVNPVKVGIRELKITKNGVDVKHFFVVPKGSTEFSSTPAPSNCMFDVIEGKYYQGNGSFDIVEGYGQAREIDVTDAVNGRLNGQEILDIDDSDTNMYTYKDGNGTYWAADYLEVNQQEGKVVLYSYSIGTGGVLSYNPLKTYIREPVSSSGDGTFDNMAEELLDIKTTHIITVLGNESGAWMDGIIGPIVDYEILLGSNTDSNISIGTNVKINVLDLNKLITATNSTVATFTGVTWKATLGGNFTTSKMSSGDSASITAKDILFSSDKLLQQYAQENNGNYFFEIDVIFLDVPVSIMEVIVDGIDIKIGGMLKSSAIVITNAPITIEGVFDKILYEFDEVVITSGTYSNLSNDQHIITLTPTSDIIVEYTIKPKEYDVQIIGKTTSKDDIVLDAQITDGYTGKVWYNKNKSEEIIKNDLRQLIEDEYVNLGYTVFGNNCVYEFAYFECNGREITGNNLTLDMLMIRENPSINTDVFTIYAVYQKKYILNIGFGFEGTAELDSEYELSPLTSPSAKRYTNAEMGVENCYLISEGETAVIILKPDKRYSVLTVLGDNGMSQVTEEILVVVLDQSYDITISLKHRTIRVDFALDIVDNNHRYIFGMPEYISGGSEIDANFTEISYEDTAQTLTANQNMLDKFNYRSVAIMIFNYRKGEYELITEKFADGKLNAKNDDFFEFYVDENGNSRICLFVIQQYFVDFSTPGFVQDSATFTNVELGSYTIEFIGGEYTSLGDGKYAVDFGTEVRLEKTIGQYGKFAHFTGLNDEENTAESFFVYGDRYIGVSFESTKLAAWIMPTIFSGSGVVFILILMTILLVLRSIKLKREKLEKEAEIQDMKRKFNIAEEISKLRNGEDVPQS